ncbi:MAG: hypothetical protein ABI876_18065 [Bacteroidota bacterium]
MDNTTSATGRISGNYPNLNLPVNVITTHTLAHLWPIWLTMLAVVVLGISYLPGVEDVLSRFGDGLAYFTCALLAYSFGDFIILRGINTREQIMQGNVAYALLLIAFPCIGLAALACS